MGYNQEIGQITQALEDIREKAPQKYVQIKKEILIKHAEINLIDTFLKISKELDNWK